MRIKTNGREGIVEFLNGQPWYVTVSSPNTGFSRTIWHKDTKRPISLLASRFINAAVNRRKGIVPEA